VDEKIKQLVNQVKEHLTQMYGEKIKQIILYGSHVRGEALKDSDIDILVLVDESLNPFEVRRRLSDLLFDILLEKDKLHLGYDSCVSRYYCAMFFMVEAVLLTKNHPL